MPTLEEIIKVYGQIPNLTTFKRPMFVGPHPDDIEFGCGGLISRLKELNVPIIYAIVTDGAAGSSDCSISAKTLAEIRKSETLKAADFMKVTSVEFLDLEDGGDFSKKDIIRKLAPLVIKYNPDIIFAPDNRLKTECHGDHLKTGEAIRRLSQIVSHPESLRRWGIDIEGITVFPNNITLAFYFTDEPNKKVEISEKNLEEKIQSLLFHESQMKDENSELLLNYFKLKALKEGEGTDTGLAESYQVLIPLMQHVYAEGICY